MARPVLELLAEDGDQSGKGVPSRTDQVGQQMFAQPLLAASSRGGLRGALVPELLPLG